MNPTCYLDFDKMIFLDEIEINLNKGLHAFQTKK